MVTIHCKFIITVKKNGKICHSYASNNYVYRRKEVKESGVAYFTCNVDGCSMFTCLWQLYLKFMCLRHLYLMFTCLWQLYLMFMCLRQIRSNEPPPRQHKFYSSIDCDVMIDQSGLPIEGKRTRSQTHSLSSTSSTLMASNVSINKDKRQCQTCLKYYGKYYLPKHMMKCKKNI